MKLYTCRKVAHDGQSTEVVYRLLAPHRFNSDTGKPASDHQFAYIPITRSIARRHTAQNAWCRVNMMQFNSGR